jgi:hypothetical protein
MRLDWIRLHEIRDTRTDSARGLVPAAAAEIWCELYFNRICKRIQSKPPIVSRVQKQIKQAISVLIALSDASAAGASSATAPLRACVAYVLE